MIFLEQESNIAEIKNLLNRSPLQEIFLAHLEETTKVMRKSALLSSRPSSLWQALRGSRSTLPLPYGRGHSVPRERYSLQCCSHQACFPSPSFYKLVTKSPRNGTGARTSLPLCFPTRKSQAQKREGSPMEQTAPSSPASKTSWGTKPEMESVEGGRGRLAGKDMKCAILQK